MPALTGETPIIASGTVTLTMIVNLKRFVQRGRAPDGAGIDTFEQVRGTPSLADYLEALPERIQSPFVRDADEDALLIAAHQLRIFRGYVIEQYFFPTYRLDENAFLARPGRLSNDDVLVGTFPLWDYQVTLSRNGFANVRMIRHFEDVPLSFIASEVQAVERARDGDGDYAESRSSWRIAMDVTAALVQALGGEMVVPGRDGAAVHIPLDPEQTPGSAAPPRPLHHDPARQRPARRAAAHAGRIPGRLRLLRAGHDAPGDRAAGWGGPRHAPPPRRRPGGPVQPLALAERPVRDHQRRHAGLFDGRTSRTKAIATATAGPSSGAAWRAAWNGWSTSRPSGSSSSARARKCCRALPG